MNALVLEKPLFRAMSAAAAYASAVIRMPLRDVRLVIHAHRSACRTNVCPHEEIAPHPKGSPANNLRTRAAENVRHPCMFHYRLFAGWYGCCVAAFLRAGLGGHVPKCRTLPHSAEECRRLAARGRNLPNSAARPVDYCRLQLKTADSCRTFVRFLFMAWP
jgi:hypothetical protein